jgi:hypothetical protein
LDRPVDLQCRIFAAVDVPEWASAGMMQAFNGRAERPTDVHRAADTLRYPLPRGSALLTRGRVSRNETRQARKSAWCEPLEWLRRLPESDGGAALQVAQVDPNAPIPQDSALHFGGLVRSNGGDGVPRISRLGGDRPMRCRAVIAVMEASVKQRVVRGSDA